MSGHIPPKKAPDVQVPKGSNICQLSIINTTTDITAPPSVLVEPPIPGHVWINLPTYAYYIKNEKTGAELLFDAGCRKDWDNAVPGIASLVRDGVPGFKVEKDTIDILSENGIDLNKMKAFILSHWHFDHCGNIAALPKSMDLVVGPGFSDRFLPGYPAKEESTYHEADFEGRKVDEIKFSDDLKIGKYQAFDYLGDGSFYILNVPGHATGHISALVRTTPDTFVVLGGDVCHFTGSIRPTEYIPLPEHLPKETALDHRIPAGCPCAAFTSSHRDPDNSRTTPFYKVSRDEHSFYEDADTAEKSIDALKEFDADPNILISIAHDPTPLDVFTFFPKGTMNDWKAKGWKEQMHWGFLNELPYEGKTVRDTFVDGLYLGGKKLRDLAFQWTS